MRPYSAASIARSGNPANAAGFGPPVAQSSSSAVWTIGIAVPFPIWVAQPMLPVAMTSGRIRSMLATFRSRSRLAISGWRML